MAVPLIVTTSFHDATASEGFFPKVVTDVFSKTVTNVFDARFGVPLSVTDANGLITTSSYDPVGRSTRVTPPSSSGLSAGFAMITSYERCGADVACSDNRAVMRVVQSQFGGDQSAVYLDSLGRTIRSVSSLLGNGVAITPSAFSEVGRSVSDVVYNNKGQVFRQYEPNTSGPNLQAFTEFEYDVVGRPITKWQRFNRVDQDVLPNPLNPDPTQIENYRRTRYTHMGTRTEVEVCQVNSINAPCSSLNADGSPVLRMSRLYDSSGKVLSTTDAAQFGQTAPKSTRFWYDGAGNPLRITDVLGLSIDAEYNNFGHRTKVTDPSRGSWNSSTNSYLSWSFSYNGYGELKTQTDARGLITTMNYDKLGRAVERSWSEPIRSGSGNTNFIESTLYNNDGSNYGTVQKVSRIGATPGGLVLERWETTPSYDALQRATSSSTLMQEGSTSAITLVQRTAYDRRFGRVIQVTYPQSAMDSQPVSIYQYYSNLGMLIREGFAADYTPSVAGSLNINSSPAIRVVSQVDGRGLITSERYGVQGVQQDWFSNSIYDSSGWLLAQCVNQYGGCSMFKPTQPNNQPLDQRYRFDVYGNLKKQWHNGGWRDPITGVISSGALGEERYTYDALQRLTVLNRTGNGTASAVNYGFDEIGKLTSKSDYASSYSYPSTSHRLSSVTLNSNSQTINYSHDANGNVTSRSGNGSAMALIYDIDNLPRTISQDNRVANFYSAPGGRYLQKLNGRDTWYLGKAYEREVNSGQVSTERYYLTSGSLLVINTAGRKLNYLHTDRLGSPVSISEKPLLGDGKLGTAAALQVEHKGFDPFGKALDGNWGISNLGMLNLPSSGIGVNQNKRNQRGFTGHEHLDEFALIHMNGRAYDYNLGQFYGVDPFVQFPSNSQSLNPYAYLMNNPLSGTDPTGYCGTRIEGHSDPHCSSFSVNEFPDTSNSGGNPRKEGGLVRVSDERYRQVTNEDGSKSYERVKLGNGARNRTETTDTSTTNPADIGSDAQRQVEKPITTKIANAIADGITGAAGIFYDLTLGSAIDAVDASTSAVTDAQSSLKNGDPVGAIKAVGTGIAAVGAAVALRKLDAVADLRNASRVEDASNHGLKYDPRVRERGVQDGVGHNFPYSFDDAILGTDPISLRGGAQGYAIRGSHDGKAVVYNMVVKDGVITHRDFVSASKWAQRSKSFGFNIDYEKLPGQ